MVLSGRAWLSSAAAAVSLAVLCADPLSAQGAPSAQAVTVAVAGDVPKPFTLTMSDLKAMPRSTVSVRQETGATAIYEGVLLAEVLRRAGAPLGRELSGNAVASYVLATATDGYQAVFALAEADPLFTAGGILVADTLDGKPLFDYQGPVRLVVPQDKRGARSVRMLQRIEVVRLRK
jgi:DMSO/TMAO reductase YedYZ molybdopterin-dependent catalytic subunit